MKLTPEQIRERAAAISKGLYASPTKEIIKLVEDATGEKLPEPFDEDKVVHGSVWGNGRCFITVLESNGGNGLFTSQFHTKDASNGMTVACTIPPGLSKKQLIESLKYEKFTNYIGQYDFAAGLPKP